MIRDVRNRGSIQLGRSTSLIAITNNGSVVKVKMQRTPISWINCQREMPKLAVEGIQIMPDSIDLQAITTAFLENFAPFEMACTLARLISNARLRIDYVFVTFIVLTSSEIGHILALI